MLTALASMPPLRYSEKYSGVLDCSVDTAAPLLSFLGSLLREKKLLRFLSVSGSVSVSVYGQRESERARKSMSVRTAMYLWCRAKQRRQDCS